MVGRYHPLLRLLHWLLALLITGMLLFGFGILMQTPNSAPEKLSLLMWHMALRMVILGLTLVRLVVLVRTSSPEPVAQGSGRKAAQIVHAATYILVIGLAASGMTTAIVAHLNDIVFAGSGGALPESLADMISWQAHRIAAIALSVTIGLHSFAVLHHVHNRRDLLIRMTWINRTLTSE